MNFEKQRSCDDPLQRQHGRVVALQMPYLQNSPAIARGLDQTIGAVESRRNRFLDKYIDAGLHQFESDFRVQARGLRRDNGCIDTSAQIAIIGEGEATGGGFRGADRIRIDHGGELGAIRFARHAHMIAAELAGPHHCHTNSFHSLEL